MGASLGEGDRKASVAAMVNVMTRRAIGRNKKSGFSCSYRGKCYMDLKQKSHLGYWQLILAALWRRGEGWRRQGDQLRDYFSSPGEMLVTWTRIVEVEIQINGHIWDILRLLMT